MRILVKQQGQILLEEPNVIRYTYDGHTVNMVKRDGIIKFDCLNAIIEVEEDRVMLCIDLSRSEALNTFKFLGRAYGGCFDDFIRDDCGGNVDSDLLDSAMLKIYNKLSLMNLE